NFNAFAQDDVRLQDIKHWKQFFTKKGNSLSYRHVENDPLAPYIQKYEKIPGYRYFWVRVDPSEEFRDELQKDFLKRYPEEFKNTRLGYLIDWVRIDGQGNMLEPIHEFIFSNMNELIVDYDGNDKPKPLKGSIYERIPFDQKRILREKEAAKLKAWQEEIRRKYGVEKVEMIGDLENNPYEYEGRTIAVLVQFKKMLSSTSAIFFSGYTNLSDLTGAPDQIIVTGIPKGTHFKGGFMAPRVMLALKGKGTIEGTNAFGARINAPHFQWVGIVSGEQKSVFEEQGDISRENALQNIRNSRRTPLR
ncbi:MAG: hypothetical protein WC248_07290, partial [Candidatus Methanomethylophilaceae archaeon]